MTRPGRLGPNLATLGNAVLGVGSILYTLAGNKLWAMLLIIAAVSLDGLDGYLARRGGLPPDQFGRYADSAADAISFGLAPGFLIAVHSWNASLWAPYSSYTLVAGIVVAGLAMARLTYFTWRGYQNPYFLGIPSPMMALAVVLVGLLADQPPFLATWPLLLLAGAGVLGVLMVVPIRFPKIRRGSALRIPMTVTAVGFVVAIILLQFVPAPPSVPWWVAFGATVLAGLGIAAYVFTGPLVVARDSPRAEAASHG